MRSPLTCSTLPSQRLLQALLPFTLRSFLYSSCSIRRSSLSPRLGVRSCYLWPFRYNISECSRPELLTKSSSVFLYRFGIAKISDFCLAPPTACLMTFFLSSTIIRSRRCRGVSIQVFPSRA